MRRVLSILIAGGVALTVTACDEFLAPEPATFASSET